MEAHSGTIQVSSPGEGLGTTFILRLPLVSPPDNSNQGNKSSILDDMEAASRSVPPEEPEELMKEDYLPPIPRKSLQSRASFEFGLDPSTASAFASSSSTVGLHETSSQPSLSLSLSLKEESIPRYHRRRKSSMKKLASIPLDGQLDENSSLYSFNPQSVYKILVVDDSVPNRKMLCKALSKKGALCEQAEDGFMAIHMVQMNTYQLDGGNSTAQSSYHLPSSSPTKLNSPQPSTIHLSEDYIIDGEGNATTTANNAKQFSQENNAAYDAILIDYEMPKIDGPSAIKEIRRSGYVGLIVGLTGHGEEYYTEKMLAAGADQVVLKPVDVDVFWAMLEGSQLRPRLGSDTIKASFNSSFLSRK